MGQYTSYWMYQKYETRGEQDPIPVYPNYWSVDADGTLPRITKLENDEECGYRPDAQYRWVNMDITKDYYCDECGSITRWVKSDETICVEIEPQYRTLTTATTCVGYDLHVLEEHQVSTDGGITWTTTATTTGSLIEADSEDCGYVPSYENQYFTIVPRGNGNIKLTGASSSFKYTYDSGATWNDATSATSISMTNGQKIMFKGTLREGRDPVSQWGIGTFSASTTFDAEGNVMSLLYSDNYVNKKTLIHESTLNKLFYGSRIVSAENMVLPATATTFGCYSWMFGGCKGLTTGPALPATVITSNCYYYMFYNCTSLTTAPELPATTLETDVKREGYCYGGMFKGCTSLTQSPILPAKVLSWGCYPEMFKGCTSLSKITCYAETNLDVASTVHEWAKNVSQTGTFYKKAGASWPSGDSGIPSGWTIREK